MGVLSGTGCMTEMVSMRFKMWEKIINECPEYAGIAEGLVNQWFNSKIYGCVYNSDIIEILYKFENEIIEAERISIDEGTIILDILQLTT